MDASLAPDRRSISGIQAILNRPDPGAGTAAVPPREEDEAVSLLTMSGDYRAFAMPSYKPLPRVHFFLKDRAVRVGMYADLDSFPEYRPATGTSGETLILCFKSRIITEVTIEGRHLWPLFDYLSLQRMPWMRELPAERDFEPESSPVIHRIAFHPVEF
ncbi:hypothetical protein [Planctomyces sp. SH-PL62]|uniref:hypothetical protein n=1 Tax=Planctomyces sp. SH-PL62 TaxID=1636152 RepID=UPI00078E1FF7|nr:hypothetical protein [Planctomyces sp. SH-PL62]AMV40246.1 hypothetical protein VT85_22635 [Planctomyces sp. SH-PL62]